MVSIYKGRLSASTVSPVTTNFGIQLTNFILHAMECSIFFGKHWTTQHLRMDVYHQYNRLESCGTQCSRDILHFHNYWSSSHACAAINFVPVLQIQQQGMVKRVDKWRDTFSKVTLCHVNIGVQLRGHSLLHTVPSRVEAEEVQAAVLHSPRWHLVMP